MFCDALKRLLDRENDMEVVGQASDGQQLLNSVEQARPDVVIVDISMPVLGGIEAARTLRDVYPEIKIIILSCYGDKEHIFRALDSGVNGYVLKDCAGSELVNAIRAILLGRLYLTSKVVSTLATDYLKLRRETRAESESPLDCLSAREIEVLRLQVGGANSREIAEKLHLSTKTVETYRYRVKEKLQIRKTVDLIKFAIQNGLTTLEAAGGHTD